MTDLERRLELALKAASSPARKKLKRLTRERERAHERLELARDKVMEKEIAFYVALDKENEARRALAEDDRQKKLANRIEYNHKVRNR